MRKSQTWAEKKNRRKIRWFGRKKFSLFWRQILLEESIKCENFLANVRFHAYLSPCFCAIYSIKKKQVGVSTNWKHLNKLRTFVFGLVWQHTSIIATIVIWKNLFFSRSLNWNCTIFRRNKRLWQKVCQTGEDMNISQFSSFSKNRSIFFIDIVDNGKIVFVFTLARILSIFIKG